MSVAVGIDIGAYKHAVAVCRSGEREADPRTLQISADRTGFRAAILKDAAMVVS